MNSFFFFPPRSGQHRYSSKHAAKSSVSSVTAGSVSSRIQTGFLQRKQQCRHLWAVVKERSYLSRVLRALGEDVQPSDASTGAAAV